MKSKKSIIGLSVAIVALALIIAGGFLMLRNKETATDVRNKANVEWYNENGTEFTITTAEELFGLVKLAEFYDFKGQTIKLGADIVVNEGEAADWEKQVPEYKWYPINKFAGTFDGQGHTISGLYVKAYDIPIGMFANTQSACRVQNFRMVNSYFEGYGNAGVSSIGSQGGGTFNKIYSSAIVKGEGKYCGGMFGKMTGVTNVDECWFDGQIQFHGRMTGGIVGGVGAQFNMSHCLYTGEILVTWIENAPGVGGLCGCMEQNNSEIYFKDCLSAGKIISENPNYVGAVTGILYPGSTSNFEATYSSMDCLDMALGRNGVQGELYGAPIELLNQHLVGENGYKWTNLDFEKYWTIVSEDTPILKHFAEEVPSVEGLAKAFNMDWYDENAKEMVISTKEELYGFYMVSSSSELIGKTIKLGADIIVNEGNSSKWSKDAPDSFWYPIKKFGGTFDGQGHTISGLYYKGEGEKIGLFSETNIYATIKNLKLKNSYFEKTTTTDAMLGSISGRGGGILDTIYSDAILVSKGNLVGGLSGQFNKEGTNRISNCWFDGELVMSTKEARYGGGIVGNVVKGETTIEHCLNTGTITCKAINMGLHFGGLVGTVMNENTILNFKDCLNVGLVKTDYHVCVGSVIGRITSAPEVSFADTYAITESYLHPDKGHMGIGTESAPTKRGGVMDVEESKMKGYGGYQWTSLDFKNYWVVDLKGTPILKSFANSAPSVAGLKKMADYSWYNESKDTYILDSAEDLIGFTMISKTTDFAKKTIKLGADITINTGNATDWATNAPAIEWSPANKSTAFAGTFDGQGHTISGLYTDSELQYTGLFGRTAPESTVKNLRLVNSYFNDSVSKHPLIGSIAGRGNGTFDTIYSDAIISCTGNNSGGLIGWIDQAGTHKITNCWYAGTLKTSGQYAGGIVGEISNVDLVVDNCLFTGNIISTTEEENGAYTGGLLGHLTGTSTLKMTECLSAGKVEGKAIRRIGTIIGQSRADITFDAVYTTNSVVNTDGNSIVFSGGMNPGVGSFSNNSDGVKTPAWVGMPVLKEELNITGLNGYKYTALNFYSTDNTAGKWVVRNNQTPALKSFVAQSEWISVAGIERDNPVTADTSWITQTVGTQKDPYIIADAADLYGLSELSKINNFNGKYFKVVNDIAVNSGNAAEWNKMAPMNVFTPIGRSTAFAGTFDGQGHTISGIYVNSSVQYTGLFGRTAVESTVKNLRLTNSYFTDTTSVYPLIGSIAGIGNGTFDTIYSDAYVNSAGAHTGGIIGWNETTGNTKIINCWYAGTITVSGQAVGGIMGRVDGATTTLESCLFTGKIISTCKDEVGAYAGGMVGRVPGGSVVKLTDCLSNGTIVVNTTMRVGTLFGQSRGDLEFVNVYTTNGISNANGATINFSNGMNPGVGTHSNNSDGTKTPVWSGYPILKKEADISGLNGYKYTGLNFYTAQNTSGRWVALEGKAPVLKSFAQQGGSLELTGVQKETMVVADKSFIDETAGTEEDPYLIKDAADLYGLSELSKSNNFSGKYIKVVNDITVNRNAASEWSGVAPMNEWTPIGRGSETAFAGTFDGAGHTISGLYVNSSEQYVGLFGRTAVGSTVKNLRLENSYFNSSVTGYALMGSIAGKGDGTFDTIYSNAIVTCSGQTCGGIVGWVGTSGTHVFENCWFDGTVTSSGAHIGGIVAHGEQGTLTLKNCLNTGTITSTITMADSGNMGGYVGGLIGRLATVVTTTLEDCVSAGEVITNSTARAAMLIGCSRANLTFTHVYAIDALRNVNNDAISFTNGVEPCVGTHSTNDGPVWTGAPQLANEILGTDGYKNTALPFYTQEVPKGAWVARSEKVPALKAFVQESEWLELTGVERPIIVGEPDTEWISKTAGTEKDPYIISTPEELYGLAQLSANNNFSGKYIKLANDIIVNTGKATEWADEAPQNVWTQISLSKDFAGTFDGDGYTISGLYLVSSGQYVGLFGRTAVGSTIKNLRLENSYFNCTNTGYALTGSIAGKGNGSFDTIYSNAIVVSSGKNTGGILGWVEVTGTRLVQNCWFAGSVTSSSSHIGGILGHADNGPITLRNCLNTGTITSTITMAASEDMGGYVGGLIGRLAGGASLVTIEDCLNTGSIITNSTARSATLIGCSRANVSFIDAYTLNTLTNVNNATINFSGGMNPGVGTFSNNGGPVWSGLPVLKTEADIKGENAYKNTNLDFYRADNKNGAWVARADKTPALKAFVAQDEWLDLSNVQKPVVVGAADTSWMVSGGGTQANPYIIADAADLLGLAQVSVSDNFSGKYIKLANDIVMNEGNAKDWAQTAPTNIWSPIGRSSATAFAGTFDGGGHTVSGLYVSESAQYMGFFGRTANGSMVKNLRLENSYFNSTNTGNAFVGGVAGKGNGSIDSIYVDVIINCKGSYVGGVFGWGELPETQTISNSWFAGSITVAGQRVGGFMGMLHNVSTRFENCLFTGSITSTASGDAYAGGFVGNAAQSKTPLVMKECLSVGNMTVNGTSRVGMLIGQSRTDNTFTNVYLINNITAKGGTINFNSGYEPAVGAYSRNSDGSNTPVWTGEPKVKVQTDVTGDAAKSTLTGFDFVNIWKAVTGKFPILIKLER